MQITENISKLIPPNYSTWETIELSYLAAKQMEYENIDGDFVECGIAAGNNFGAMCKAGRHGYGFDSFDGIPWAGEFDDQQPGMAAIPEHRPGISSGISSHSMEAATENLSNWGIDNYTLIKGWFSETIPNQKFVKNISVLRLDCDMHESTLTALTHLYPLLSKGGILIIDDWGLAGCRRAVMTYFKGVLPLETTYFHGVKYFKNDTHNFIKRP